MAGAHFDLAANTTHPHDGYEHFGSRYKSAASNALWVVSVLIVMALSIMAVPASTVAAAVSMPIDVARCIHVVVSGALSSLHLGIVSAVHPINNSGGGDTRHAPSARRLLSLMRVARCLPWLAAAAFGALGPMMSPEERSDMAALSSARELSLPFNGSWLPEQARSAGLDGPDSFVHSALSSDTKLPAETSSLTMATFGASHYQIYAHPDSGCSGSLTWNEAWLINKRPCNEVFSSAHGKPAKSTVIGDMPVVVCVDSGEKVKIVIRNVRCVPDFTYTLLSVTQLWEEQKIDARFADTKALVLPSSADGRRVPYASEKKLPTIRMVSAVAPGLAYSRHLALAAGQSSSPLGFHRVGATAHVARLPAAQAAELLHRRGHMGVDKLRALAHMTRDVPKNLSHAPACSCEACASARIKRTSHSGTLAAPAPEPGVLHVDLKELKVDSEGYRYVVFAIDEYSRYVFVDFIKNKSDAMSSIKRIIAAFNATVGTPIDADGHALERPKVRELHSDREGKLMSKAFLEFRGDASLHHTTSPPHDHDLNPIAERIIGLISENASTIKLDSDAPTRRWRHLISYAVDWHNATITSAGSSSASEQISPCQRFTLRPPSVMDLAAFGSMAVVLKPPTHQDKTSLAGRGWKGKFLGRSINSKGCYDVEVDGKVRSSSSVLIDEEQRPWAPQERRHRPLTSLSHAALPPQQQPLAPLPAAAPSSVASAPATPDLRLLSLFSGPYSRADGLAAALTSMGWSSVTQIDNDGERGGGWSHDLLNDATYASILADVSAGKYDGIMIAFPCSTFSITRFFDASTADHDSGPPILRTAEKPDGLPESEIDPKYRRELEKANELLERTINIAIAARRSVKQTSLIIENPADRSLRGTAAFSERFKNHGSLFATSAYKRLVAVAELESSTFAYCTIGSPYQKYTTIAYTRDTARLLNALDAPEFKCNHSSHPKQAGGRGPDGAFVSGEAAAYPAKLNWVLARAFTLARTGSTEPITFPAAAKSSRPAETPPPQAPTPATPSGSWWMGAPTPPQMPTSRAGGVPSSAGGNTSASAPGSNTSASSGTSEMPSPVSFRGFSSASDAPAAEGWGPRGHPQRERKQTVLPNLSRASVKSKSYSGAIGGASSAAVPSHLDAVEEEPRSPLHELDSPSTYTPFAGVMERAAAESAFSAAHHGAASFGDDVVMPISEWQDVETDAAFVAANSGIFTRLPGGRYALSVDVALAEGEAPSQALLVQVAAALRADSPDAPSTHVEAMKLGEVWVKAEGVEFDNHARNESWTLVSRADVPKGRRIHKLIWVYKVKRDGSAKARLCVQGTTLQMGIDFDQTFSAALRYSSARGLFAYAAGTGCDIRSVDLVAAYLQGKFLDGEVVYCYQPPGHVKYDSSGQPLIARVDKPIYGIQQAGRRLQRLLFAWMRDQGFKPLDDSDPCVFVREHADGEILKIGLYVDNLQIVHSAKLDASGRGPEGCAYNSFMDALTSDWEVLDEGPMDDLLGIEVQRNADGSITLHQRKYIEKIGARFLPDGPPSNIQSNSLPYSADFLLHCADALAQPECEYPELVRPFQERIGCLMYATTSTRPDIAFPVHRLCQCLQKPTPQVVQEADRVLAYLLRHAGVGLTYSSKQSRLSGFADASWEARNSTSGWVVDWNGCALTWGSKKQKCIALSTCEAEIIALSEATKDVVYLRKFLAGIGAAQDGPSTLATDSKSARDVAYNPEHHDRMKHVLRRHFFVRDMVEEFEIVVPYVPTDDNLADFFTKPFKSVPKFFDMRALIMNEPKRPDAP
jgi:hypothetical protein